MILLLDPMNHFIRFEEYWQNKNETKANFTSLIRDELPQQTYLDLAIWYSNLNLMEEGKAVLEACPQKDNEIIYWLAWLNKDNKNGDEYLKEANNGNAYMVFPFRTETIAVMEWAVNKSPNWKSRYYLALIYSFHEHKAKALQLLENEKVPDNFAPYYVLRSRLRDSSDVQNIQSDLSKAQQIDKSDWRYGKYLTEFLLSQKRFDSALMVIEPYYKKDKENYMAGLLYARCLMLNNNYNAAEKIFDHINILPYEGAQAAHNYYEQTKLMLALQFLKKYNYKIALKKVNEAMLWPENLGAGEPYPDMFDNSLENDIQKLINETKGGQKLSLEVFNNYESKVKAITNGKGQ
jgi:hypothetical protein